MQSQNRNGIPHYYGDITRAIFIVAALVLLVGLPTMTARFGIPAGIPALGVTVLVIAAGITNPVQRGSLVLNMIVLVGGLGIFVYLSWFMYTHLMRGPSFVLNQVIAALFLWATYLSIKSVRGYSLNKSS